jgi:hypothetical protein
MLDLHVVLHTHVRRIAAATRHTKNHKNRMSARFKPKQYLKIMEGKLHHSAQGPNMSAPQQVKKMGHL